MRKNKGLFFVVAILLAVTCLFISCSAEVSENAGGGDKLVYATFGKGSAKDLTGSSITTYYNLEDIKDVYWFYKASKNSADHGGTSGTQTAWYPVIAGQKGLDGVIGPFSTGLWDFEVAAYQECVTENPGTGDYDISVTVGQTTYYMTTLVFAGSATGVSLTSGTQANPDPINVTVTLQAEGSTGTVTLDGDFVFEWETPNTNSTTDLTLKASYVVNDNPVEFLSVGLVWEDNKYVISSTSTTQWEKAAGNYDLDFEVYYTLNDVNYTVATVSNVPLTVYGGQETVIKASILEGNFVYAKINATVKSTAVANTVTTNSSTTFVTSYTPASVKSGSVSATEVTTVEFEAGAIAPTGTGEQPITEYILTTNVSDLESAQNRGFTVQTGNSAAGSIDLSLKKVVAGEVSDAEITGNVRIVTYIATNLSDVHVHYDGTGTAPTDVEYDSTTGRLSFVTTHFSEYYVTTTSEAYNSNKVKAYSSLRDALNDAAPNDTIVLLKDADLGDSYNFSKSVTILGQGHKVIASNETGGYSSSNEGRVFNISDVSNIDVTLVNLKIKGEDNAVRGISLYNTSNINLTLSSCNVWANYYAINIASLNTNLHVTLKDTTTSTGWCAIQSWSSGVTVDIEGGKLIGINNKPYDAVGYNNFSTIVINDPASDNTWNISNCTIQATSATGNIQGVIDFRTAYNTSFVLTDCTIIQNDGELTPLVMGIGLNCSLKIDNVEQIEWSFDVSNLAFTESIPSGSVAIKNNGGTVKTINISETTATQWAKGVDYTVDFSFNDKYFLFDLDVSSDAYGHGYMIYIVETTAPITE